MAKNWTPEKRASFIKAWNEGLDREGLVERFGVARPEQAAKVLRDAGLDVHHRTTHGAPVTGKRRTLVRKRSIP